MALVYGFFLWAPLYAQGERVAFVGAWERSKLLLWKASRQVGVDIDIVDIPKLLDRPKGWKVIYVLNLNPAKVPSLVLYLRKNPSLVLPLDHRDSQLPLKKAGLLTEDTRVQRYWKYHGFINLKRLLEYTKVKYLGKGGEVLPPVVIPDFGIYHPEASEIYSTAQEFLQWYRTRPHYRPSLPWAVLFIHQSFWVTNDCKVIDALVRSFESHGVQIATVFADRIDRIVELVRPLHPQLFLLQVHSALTEGGTQENPGPLRGFGIPFLKPISLLGAIVEDWRKDPRGLTPKDVNLHLTIMEAQGVIEPLVVGGLEARTFGFRLHVPIGERIERFTRRALAWLRLRRKKNSQKKIAILYYNKYLGKSDLMRGSPTGAYLDAPRSLLRLLRAMKKKGYGISYLPKGVPELLGMLQEGGRNIAPWARKEILELLKRGNPALVPLSLYRKWFAQLPEALQKSVVKNFGQPPGKIMTVVLNGEPQIILPKIDLGNIVLMPQPVRGERMDTKLLHSRQIPPPHNYIAFYFWLERIFQADAVVHFGTHGTLELLPLKGAGLAQDDWGDLLLGSMPNIYPWILDNLGEATLAKRRAYAVLIGHLVPPIVGAGLGKDYKLLHDEIDKFQSLERGLLKEQFRKSILQRASDLHLFEDMKLPKPRRLSEETIQKISEYLHQIYNETTPISLHVLGKAPSRERLVPYIVSILGKKFLLELGKSYPVPPQERRFRGDEEKYLRKVAEELMDKWLKGKSISHYFHSPPSDWLQRQLKRAKVLYQNFLKTPREIQNILLAMEGKYIFPGPGNDPVRNPASLPTGRNLYALNPEEIPVRPAWETGKILVHQLLEKSLRQKGRYPRKVAFDLNGHETMRHYGVTEAEILYLLGVRPVWNENNLVIDVELIPQKELGRPRIDVFIAMGGSYRDNFPSRVRLLDKAVRLASSAQEKENYVREFSLQLEKKLFAQGYGKASARLLSQARIFGAKPGEFGTRILHLIPRSGVWDKVDEITQVYLDTMSYVYTKNKWGVQMKELYQEAIQGTEVILRTWSSHMTSPLSNHHFFEYLGGLNLAVKALTQRNPDAYVSDVRKVDAPELQDLESLLQREFRVRLFNVKWIQGMMSNNYAGAGQMAELVKNTFGWETTRPESVREDMWREIYKVYVLDKYKLKLKPWFERHNPHALQEIEAVLLEAARKKYWMASQKELKILAKAFVESVNRHKLSGGLITGGNRKLEVFVSHYYQHLSQSNSQLKAFQKQLNTPARTPKLVRGKQILQKKPSKEKKLSKETFHSFRGWQELILFLGILLLIGTGYVAQKGVPK